jgi:hypothetical protein
MTMGFMLLLLQTAEGLNVLNWVKMLCSIDQIRLCIGLTALIKSLIAEPTRTMISQAGFFTFMIGQNCYQTLQSLRDFAGQTFTDNADSVAPLTLK